MKHKKSIIISLVFLLVTAIFAGCSSPKPKTTSQAATQPADSAAQTAPAATTAPKGVENLTFWGGVAPENGPQAVVDDWNAKNPDIQVKYVFYTNDDPGNLKL